MKIFITLTGHMAVDLAGYLWEKFSERDQVAQKRRRNYSQEQFAADIGIKTTTLNSIMNAEGPSVRIAWETLQTLKNYFGREFIERFELAAPDDAPASHWHLDES